MFQNGRFIFFLQMSSVEACFERCLSEKGKLLKSEPCF